MEKIIKQCIGIDVSQKEIDVSFGTYGLDQSIQLKESKKFKNDEKGFSKFLNWSLKLADKEIPLFFVMEATGVYHECLACFLYDQEQKVIVVLPNRASNYAKTLEVKTVTDKEASKSLTKMGLEKKMDLWVKPDPVFNNLKQLTREREQSQAELAERMGRPKEKINDVIKAREPISTATAFQLEKVLGIPASFWLNREKEYRKQIYEFEQAKTFRSGRKLFFICFCHW